MLHLFLCILLMIDQNAAAQDSHKKWKRQCLLLKDKELQRGRGAFLKKGISNKWNSIFTTLWYHLFSVSSIDLLRVSLIKIYIKFAQKLYYTLLQIHTNLTFLKKKKEKKRKSCLFYSSSLRLKYTLQYHLCRGRIVNVIYR